MIWVREPGWGDEILGALVWFWSWSMLIVAAIGRRKELVRWKGLYSKEKKLMMEPTKAKQAKRGIVLIKYKLLLYQQCLRLGSDSFMISR